MNCSDSTLRVTEDRGHRAPGFSPLKQAAVALLVSLSCAQLSAHDFFLWPDAHHVTPGQAVDVRFSVGHGGDYDAWAHGKSRVLALAAHGPDRVSDALGGVAESAARVSLLDEGTHVLSLVSGPASSVLGAEKFNAYLLEEGLIAVAAHRSQHQLTDRPGSERYSRRAKTLLQVGNVATDNVTRPLGLMLELVPLMNPYALDEEDALTLQVLFNGAPLSGATVAFESLSVAHAGEQRSQTDARGRVSFRFPKVGQWKANVVWSTPARRRDEADYETLFSSLTFGYATPTYVTSQRAPGAAFAQTPTGH